MMAAINTLRYNELPSLDEANFHCQARSVEGIINGPLRDVFLKHRAHTTFCLYLQHRHHTVEADNAVVKVNGTAHLMSLSDIRDIESFGNKVTPTTWMTCDSGVLPMEFGIATDGTGTVAPGPEFTAELASVLALNECQGLFGIDTIAMSDWAEMTIGNASVVVPSHDNDLERFIPVAFVFDEKKPGFKVHGKCGKDHKHTSKPEPKK